MRAVWWWLIGGAAVAALGTGGGIVYTHYKERGIRNNNPGNLRISNNAWLGKVPAMDNTDKSFEQFKDYKGTPGHVWGIRAMYMDLRGDVLKDGRNTVRKLIESYAPPHENKTEKYIAFVAEKINKGANDLLTLADVQKMLPAIIQMENGIQPYPPSDIVKAIALAA